MSQIHPSAVVEQGAQVGEGTRVWHHAHVRSGSAVGRDCVLGKNVYIDNGVLVGDRCKVQNNVSLYRGVVIGDDVFIGPSATFTNDRIPRAFNPDWVVSETYVGSGASIGANATIVCGTTIGEYAMVAAGATVTRSVDPYQLVGGIPARHMGWVCRCGEVLARGEARPTNESCTRCNSASAIPPTGSSEI